MNANKLTSRVVPIVLRGAQQERVVRIADVSAWLTDAGLPGSTGTVHNLIQSDEIDGDTALVILERMALDQLAYGAARAAGGTFRRANHGTGDAMTVAAGMLGDLSGIMAILADGKVDPHELPALLKACEQVRDQAAGLIERFGSKR